jgi:Trypsin
MNALKATERSDSNVCQPRAVPATHRRAGWMLGALWSAVSLTVGLSACEMPPESQDDDGPATTQSFELKNGTLPDDSYKWRGVVRVDVYWPDFSGWSKCSGTITSRTTLVTAAHCVTQPLGASSTSGYVWVIVKRETSPGVYQTLLPATRVFTKYNPAYDGWAPHDVAVITSPVQWAYITQSDAIAIAKGAPSGATMWALGYGYYDNGYIDGQGRAGQVTPIYGGQEYTFSASGTQPWICSGDSGGPLKMTNGAWYIYGIASLTTGNAPGAQCGPVGHWAPTADNFAWLNYAIGYDKCVETTLGLLCW